MFVCVFYANTIKSLNKCIDFAWLALLILPYRPIYIYVLFLSTWDIKCRFPLYLITLISTLSKECHKLTEKRHLFM